MNERVVVDTGPLVAMLRSDDQHHQACLEAAQDLRAPLITTWLVITEAAWLLRTLPDGVERLCDLIASGLVECHPVGTDFAIWAKAFLRQYAALRPQIADGSLVYVADALDIDQVFTLDRRDFVVYRSKKGHPFQLLPETL